jgi:hypothetical protein
MAYTNHKVSGDPADSGTVLLPSTDWSDICMQMHSASSALRLAADAIIPFQVCHPSCFPL